MRDTEKEKKPTMSWALHTVSKSNFFTIRIPSSHWLNVESYLQAKLHLTQIALNSKLSHVSQHRTSRLWDAGHLCSSKCGFFFLSLINGFCRGNFSNQNYVIGCMLTNAAVNTNAVFSPHKILQRCLWWCLKYIKL